MPFDTNDFYVLQRVKDNDPEINKLDLSNRMLENSDFAFICEALRQNTYLVTLIVHNNFITDISSLDVININNQIIHIDISNNLINSITGLKNCKLLQSLTLNGNGITSIGGLTYNINLRNLRLNSNQIAKIQGLETLCNLVELNLEENKIQKIESFEANINLEKLLLSHNIIETIEGLDRLRNLRELFLGHNNIKEIKGLANLSELKVLYLSCNRIREIDGLDNLVGLQELYLGFNRITQIKKLENHIHLRPNFFTVMLEQNPISSKDAALMLILKERNQAIQECRDSIMDVLNIYNRYAQKLGVPKKAPPSLITLCCQTLFLFRKTAAISSYIELLPEELRERIKHKLQLNPRFIDNHNVNQKVAASSKLPKVN